MTPSKEFFQSVAEMRGKDLKRDNESAEKADSAKTKAGDEVEVNPSAVHGEAGTGYEPPEVDGVVTPFDCAHCHFMVGPVGAKGLKRGEKGCNQSEMRKFSKLPKFSDGRVQVEPKGCCAYLERISPMKKTRDRTGEEDKESKELKESKESE